MTGGPHRRAADLAAQSDRLAEESEFQMLNQAIAVHVHFPERRGEEVLRADQAVAVAIPAVAAGGPAPVSPPVSGAGR